LQQQSAPSDTAAIVIEPVLGEGGYVPAPPAFLHGLRRVCDEHNILLIVDEVQSGFGRTGKFFSIEHSNVRPDILVTAKVREQTGGNYSDLHYFAGPSERVSAQCCGQPP
jgi:4-aminobutyrate aminotransferase